MTPEEMQELIDNQSRELEDLTAERDSLKDENEKLRSSAASQAEELAETKKLNFTLARQISHAPAKDIGALINDLF